MKQPMRFQIGTWLALLCVGTLITAISSKDPCDYLASDFRPPAVPLIVFDGYNNIWSMADNLYDDWPRLWDGAVKALVGMIRIDGHVYRFMGPKDIGVNDVLPQKSVQVYPTQTVYTFGNSVLDLTVTFTTPTIPTDLEKLSYPVTFISFKVQIRDGHKHSVQIYYDNTGELVVNDVGEEITWDRGSIGYTEVLRMGTAEQPVLGQSGDRIAINWGHLYITTKNSVLLDWYSGESHQVVAGSLAARNQFITQGTIPQNDDTNKPRAANNDWPVIACTWNFTLPALGSIENTILYTYDDIYSIKYFGKSFVPYWRRLHASHDVNDPTPAYELIKRVLAEHETLVEDCNTLDTKVMEDLTNIGGQHYNTIGSLVFRQAFGACKLVWNADKKVPWYFLKEISSNGDLSTVDVIFPAAPIFLYQNPTLLTYLLEPLFAYANNETSVKYNLAWAPHHLGTYPIANIYPDQQEQMPIEETGNMLMMIAAIAQRSDSIDLLIPTYWSIIESWAEYLVTVLPNPENQLCTDDFEGPSPQNVNLAAKGIIGLSSFAYLCDKFGYTEQAIRFQQIAANYTVYWTTNAYDGDHYMKQFESSGSWSLKYNILFQDFLGLSTFPQNVVRTELNFYLNSHMNTYGVPLDNGATFTKLDWLTWIAAMAAKEGNEEYWNQIIDVVYKFANETPSRVPLTDWYDTISGQQTGFQARPVLGGVYARLILPVDYGAP
eukprot:CAMPEP_0168578218 /NCGR_PEP_ID=MMETSP0413-20121227/21212_1 /TAXON_ID=136452 /ORGANISM="Filamoeba nolandi, Strain NC-AS-23-1" /LENGTH=717 /DNA_ID=CAMNT_0008612043 /DNA_START=1 /DNA_END=2154 /DNA_ORIENTATION=+